MRRRLLRTARRASGSATAAATPKTGGEKRTHHEGRRCAPSDAMRRQKRPSWAKKERDASAIVVGLCSTARWISAYADLVRTFPRRADGWIFREDVNHGRSVRW